MTGEYAHSDSATTNDRRPWSIRRERTITGFSLAVTSLASVAFLASFVVSMANGTHSAGRLVASTVFLIAVLFLVYGSLVYQFARLGALTRGDGEEPDIADLLASLVDASPSVTVLVPSYKEDLKVVRQTLLSAALQDYAPRRVVLLVDDPPNPASAVESERLEETRRLAADVQRLLQEPHATFATEARFFENRVRAGRFVPADEAALLARLLADASAWFSRLADESDRRDHTDAFFNERILREPARELRERAERLAARTDLAVHEADLEYRRLVWRFAADLETFERKRYANLSHTPNKAMNLNTYIHLMGRTVAEAETETGVHLLEADGEQARRVLDADYVLTLDADSLLLPEYMARLVSVMEHPDHAETAVSQTPYSAIPGSESKVERIAGATTDMQYIVHQGFTQYSGTYWVGANALLRKRALEDIALTPDEVGEPVHKYIQDRTVIEDTESSIDLVRRGWGLFNYPRRMSFTATPPDFGALVIQRRRWANGGLLILPKLIAHLGSQFRRGRAFAESFMRTHYLSSIAGANLAFLFLLLYPQPDTFATLWLPFTALPYFALYARDLALAGYRATDVVRVYALNLMLVPVNVGGVVQSIVQAITRRKTAFKRTPKVEHRTASPPLYILANLLLIAWCVYGLVWDIVAARIAHAGLDAVTVALLIYGFSRFITWSHAYQDVVARVHDLRSPVLGRRDGFATEAA